jgi:hypothetical protein
MEGKDHVTQTGSSSLMFSFAPHTYSFQHTTLTRWVPGPSEVQLLTKWHMKNHNHWKTNKFVKWASSEAQLKKHIKICKQVMFTSRAKLLHEHPAITQNTTQHLSLTKSYAKHHQKRRRKKTLVFNKFSLVTTQK